MRRPGSPAAGSVAPPDSRTADTGSWRALSLRAVEVSRVAGKTGSIGRGAAGRHGPVRDHPPRALSSSSAEGDGQHVRQTLAERPEGRTIGFAVVGINLADGQADPARSGDQHAECRDELLETQSAVPSRFLRDRQVQVVEDIDIDMDEDALK